jgi:PAS domain S-box-containing protein
MVFALDQLGRVSYVDEAVRTVLGLPPGGVIGRAIAEVLPPDEATCDSEPWQRLLDGEPVRGLPCRARRADGADIHLYAEATPRFDSTGRFAGAHGAARAAVNPQAPDGEGDSLIAWAAALRDAGEASAPTENLRDSLGRLLERLGKLGVDASWAEIVDDGDPATARLVAWHGPDAEDLARAATESPPDSERRCPAMRALRTGQLVVCDMSEETNERPVAPWLAEARNRGYAAFCSVPLLHGDQVLGALCLCSRQPGFWSDWRTLMLELFGHVAAAVVTGTQALERARKAEGHFQDLVEQLPCVVYVARVGDPPDIEFLTRNVEQYCGYTPAEFYAAPELIFRCMHPDDQDRVRREIAEHTRRPEPYTMRYRIQHRDGAQVRHVVAYSTPCLDEQGRIVARRGIIMDVTQETALEQQLLQSHRLAAIGEMTTMMAHEIRNPLAGMSLAIRLLRHYPDDSGTRDRCLDDLAEGLRRIDETVSRAMDFANPRPPGTRRAALGDVIEQARKLTATYLRKSTVTLETELPADLPDLAADPRQLEQVIVNLILNACKAMPHGGRLAIQAATDAEHVRIEVTDTGAGIPPEHLERIFDPFYSRFHAGAGLGLALCRRIMDAHGGSITVNSPPDQGATFRLLLPLAPES